MTFGNILRVLYKTYKVDAHFIAQKLHVDDSDVKDWEMGISKPTHHQIEDLSAMFAIPEKTLTDSLADSN